MQGHDEQLLEGPRVAIAHDYLTQRGGAEQVVLSLSRAFPDAPIHTMLYEPDGTFPEFRDLDVRVSGLNRVGTLRRNHRVALPILPLVARSMRIDADVVIASTSGWAHGFRTDGRKLAFCHSPARWLYASDMYLGDDSGFAKRAGLRLASGYLRAWDRRSAESCDRYLANSTLTRDRIAEAYDIDATVVHPPVAMSDEDGCESMAKVDDWIARTGPADGPAEAFYLCVSRLLPYKNVDAVVRAFAGTGRRLVVVGRGPNADRIQDIATPNVLVLSDLENSQLRWLYQHCRALIAASYEDYGLTPIEAGVWGRPTLAMRWGGYLETVQDGVTGLFFEAPEPEAIADAVRRLEGTSFDAEKIRTHVEQFSESRFAASVSAIVDEVAATS